MHVCERTIKVLPGRSQSGLENVVPIRVQLCSFEGAFYDDHTMQDHLGVFSRRSFAVCVATHLHRLSISCANPPSRVRSEEAQRKEADAIGAAAVNRQGLGGVTLRIWF